MVSGDKDRKHNYGSVSVGELEEQDWAPQPGSHDSVKLWVNFILCIAVGPLNFVMYKVMYSAYGDSRAFFVSQGVNLLYVIYGGAILFYLSWQGKITAETRSIPHYKFVIMGFLDCMGGFLGAMGANNTSGSLQQLLNQTLIPITMLLSWLILGRKSTVLQVIGALFILAGAWIVIVTSISGPIGSDFNIVSNIVYFSSNIPIGLSCVYKELEFRDVHMHVMYMTQWVSIYQLLWGFLAGFLQLLPCMGSLDGVSLSEINSSFWSGGRCFLHIDGECAGRSTFWLLTGYCVVNFVFNIVGLYLVKYDSATLSNITGALVLPLTVLMFNMPIMGQYREHCGWYTVVGLIIVLIGFILWRLKAIEFNVVKPPLEDDSEAAVSLPRAGQEVVRCASISATVGTPASASRLEHGQEAFSDRVIFLSIDQD
jgi:drug/metabolite transporter (DMT)-like permease